MNARQPSYTEEKRVKNFMAIYVGTPEARAKWDRLDAAERNKREAEGIEA